MVNHVETLLLNMSRTELRDAGFGPNEPWFVDESFRPIEFSKKENEKLYKTLFPDSLSIEGKVDRVLSVSRAIRLVDMESFFSTLDGRRTIDDTDPSTIRGLYDRIGHSDIGYENDFVKAVVLSKNVQNDTGVKDIDVVLPGLRAMLRTSFERTIRFSAAVLMLVYQLEAVRRFKLEG